MRLRARLRALLVPPGDGQGLVAAAPALSLREVFRRFWPYARPYRRWIAVSLVFIAAVPAVEAATIWMFKVVVDELLVPRDFGAFWWIAGAYLGLALLAGVVSFLDDYVATWVGERFLLDLRTSCFAHLQGLSLDFFERRRLGDVLSRLTGDVAAIESFVLSGVTDALSYLLRIAFFTGALFLLDWRLALVALAVAPAFWLLARRFSRLVKHASREKRRRSGSLSAVAEESLGNVPLVQAYGREDHEVQRFHRESLGAFHAELASTRIKALFTPLVDLVELLGVLVVVGMGTWELTQGRMSLGALLAFLAFLTQLYSPIRSLARLSNRVFAASASAERIAELLDARPAVVERPHAPPLGPPAGRVELDAVTFRYPGTRHDALREASLALEPGRTLAIVGPSGAGKSTIAKLLLRFYDPAAGAVRLDGRDLRELRLRDVRAAVALLLQETLIFDGTIRDNIAFGRPEASDEEIRRAAEAAGLDDVLAGLPDGLGTLVGQRGRRLSGGQRQRIAIARAMVRDAPVLVLDEPTTGLDPESARRVLEPLRRLMEGRATILVSHDLAAAREADEIAVIEDGAVVERGTHASLLAAGGVYARLHGEPRPHLEAVS